MNKQKELENKVIEICENLGWWVNVYAQEFENRFFEIGQPSPLGEDFSFNAWGDSIIQDIKKYASDFDAEAHAVMWYEREAWRGLRNLLNDADAIQEMLYELAEAVANLEVE